MRGLVLLLSTAVVGDAEAGRDERLTTVQRFNNSAYVKTSLQYVTRELLSPSMVDRIVAATQENDPISLAPDSTDQRPSNSWTVIVGGEYQASRWKTALTESIDLLTAAVQKQYASTHITPCKSLIRRWGAEGERRQLQYHYDSHAFITTVVALSASGVDFEGGLFLRSNGRDTFVSLQPGDAIMHQYDTWHGVRVDSGVRLSLVVWFLASTECTVPKLRQSWYWSDAQAGDPVAQDQLAAQYREEGDMSNAMMWLKRAAEQGNMEAMYRLGVAHAERQNWDEARRCWLLSAQAGNLDAQNNLGSLLLSRAEGAQDPRHVEGVEWMRKSAEQGHASAMFNLGKVLGQQGDLKGAWGWWKNASMREGLPEATAGLKQLRPILKKRGEL